MEFYDVVNARRSQRSYENKPVPRDILEKLVKTGCAAPTGVNKQAWKFVVVDDAEIKLQVAQSTKYGPFLADAGACVAIFYSADAVTGIDDCCAAANNILLAAVAEGLGGCWIGSNKAPHGPAVKEILGVPEDWELAVMLAIGYVKQPSDARPRKPMQDVLFWNRV